MRPASRFAQLQYAPKPPPPTVAPLSDERALGPGSASVSLSTPAEKKRSTAPGGDPSTSRSWHSTFLCEMGEAESAVPSELPSSYPDVGGLRRLDVLDGHLRAVRPVNLLGLVAGKGRGWR